MEAAEIIKKLKSALTTLKEKGQDTVPVVALENYLDALLANASESLELRKLQHQSNLAHYDAKTKHSIEMFKSVIESGKEALNALILINGGAVIALLGFMGATISKGLPSTLGASLTFPLLFFGAGVLSGALAFAARYLSQSFYANDKDRIGNTFTILSVVLASSGYGLFGLGMYGAFRAFSAQFAISS